jgi:2C-methyl-D-erythritol 2,4-cyclodiphosphate synthase
MRGVHVLLHGPCSRLLLRLQVKKMKEAGYVLGNLDATIIAQKPKLSPHKVLNLSIVSALAANITTVHMLRMAWGNPE